MLCGSTAGTALTSCRSGAPVAEVFATPTWQWLVYAGVYLALFVAPAVYVARDAKRRNAPWGRWVALTLLASLLGLMQYQIDRRITERRARE